MSLSRSLGALVVGATLAVSACGSDPVTAPTPLDKLPRSLTAAEQETVRAGNAFTFDLLREVARRKAGKNVFISPLSASMALGMTLNGAAGSTESAMRATLGFGSRTTADLNATYRELRTLLLGLDPSVQIVIANALWYRQGLPVEPAFLSTLRTDYAADARAANFADVAGTLAAINGWANTQTSGRIPKVLDTIRPDEVMFLLNALYFKGKWREQFDRQRTQSAPFQRDGGSPVSVPLMSRDNTTIKTGFANGVQVGELAYGNSAYVMTVLLPPLGTTADALAAGLDAARWDALVGALHETKMTVTLPRFTLKYEDEWKDVLTTLGMGIAFAPNQADFTRMSSLGRQMYLTFVKQNTFVQVDEEGTEAAAVTTVGVGLTSLPPSFRVDRSFVFAIRERFSGAVLFVGKVVDPTAG